MPAQVLETLIFNDRTHIEKAFRFLRYGLFKIPTPEEESHLIRKMLWKLGFDIGLYPSYHSLFWERLEKFKGAVITDKYDERDQEAIRSAGANFFVSLEEILDYSLSFTTWALLSDHYGGTKFKCNLEEARRFMASRLSGRPLGRGEILQIDPAGKNTLYALVRGFSSLADLCDETVGRDVQDFNRPDASLPGFHQRTRIELFPFTHTVMILDLGKEDRDRITSLLRIATETLERVGVCNIRNRLDHKRSDFPSKDELLAVCTGVADMVSRMEETGICPVVCLYAKEESDEYGRGQVVLRDYRGRTVEVRVPSQYPACRLPSLRKPQVVFRCARIDDSVELLRFEFEENSEYVMKWRDYPKRLPRTVTAELQPAGVAIERQAGEQKGPDYDVSKQNSRICS
jgi:hypothetical protein